MVHILDLNFTFDIQLSNIFIDTISKKYFSHTFCNLWVPIAVCNAFLACLGVTASDRIWTVIAAPCGHGIGLNCSIW